MITHNWRHLLQSTGAKFTEAQEAYFQTPAEDAKIAMCNDVLADLSHLSLLAITGIDAAKFLQGQLTCNIQEINEQQSRLGAHCNPKGRIMSSFRLFQLTNGYYLQLLNSMLATALTNLGKYAIFSKVNLNDASANLYQLGLSGPKVSDLLKQYVSTVPTDLNTVIATPDLVIMRLPGLNARYQIIGNYEAISQLWSQLSKQLPAVGANAWNLLDIMAGIPSISPETVETFTPHQINYQLIQGLSFNKGCYTGQEIIARMQYLGKLKQHMHQAILHSAQPVAAGQAVLSNSEGNLKTIGTVVMTAHIPDGYQLLISIQDSGLNNPLYIDQTSLKLIDLPYPVPIS